MNLKKVWYVLTHWEVWHYNTKYALISPVWLWYSLRARSFYFFTPANPTLTFGGFEGGPKKEIYDHLPKHTYPNSIYIEPAWPINQVNNLMADNNLLFPIAVKPNVGMMGLMFRKIDNIHELNVYHQTITVTYILQELINYPIEVSVFYHRSPNSSKGNITGFVRKEALEVTGDGTSTLKQLMKKLESLPSFKPEEWATKHQSRLQQVISAGEIFKLAWVANLSRGGKMVNIEHEKDDRLLKFFDDLSHSSKHLFYGRYDIKCTSVEDLKAGKNFSILEFNGTGAEPHHMYGNGNSLLQAFKIIMYHWNVMYHIARYHHKKGVPYKTLREGLSFTRASNRHFNHLRDLDATMPVFH